MAAFDNQSRNVCGLGCVFHTLTLKLGSDFSSLHASLEIVLDLFQNKFVDPQSTCVVKVIGVSQHPHKIVVLQLVCGSWILMQSSSKTMN